MEAIARMMIASTDLLEAEGRVFRRVASRFLLATGAGVVAVVMAIAGLGLLIGGLFALLARFIGSPLAAIVFALVALGTAAFCLITAKRLVTK